MKSNPSSSTAVHTAVSARVVPRRPRGFLFRWFSRSHSELIGQPASAQLRTRYEVLCKKPELDA